MMKLFQLINAWRNYDDMKEGIKKKTKKKKQREKTQKLERKKGRIMLSSICPVFGNKKLRFIKTQEVSGLLLGPNSLF